MVLPSLVEIGNSLAVFLSRITDPCLKPGQRGAQTRVAIPLISELFLLPHVSSLPSSHFSYFPENVTITC